MHSYGGLFEPRGSKFALLKSTFNAENFIRRLSLSPVISTQFTLEMCGRLKLQKKLTKNPYFGAQGRSRSSMLVPPESSSTVLVMMCSKSVSICNRSLARLDNSSRNRVFWRGYPNLMHLYGLRRTPWTYGPTGLNLTPLKSTFNAEHFIHRLSWSGWSILNGFGAIHS